MSRPVFSLCALVLSALLLLGCRQVVEIAAPKRITPEVVQFAQSPQAWYTYLPERAPGFCLQTKSALIWQDDALDLGHWQGLHPEPPHRLLMEARGHTFILYRHYIWDGASVGDTHLRDLLPSLRHDALYHALKEGAPISRRQIDLAFLRDQRSAQAPAARFHFLCLRLFGGLYNRPAPQKTMIIKKIRA